MPNFVKGLIVLVILAVAGGAAWKLQLFGSPDPGSASAGAPPGPGAMAMPVLAVRVESAPAQDRVKVVGSLRADESVVLRSEIDGRIARLNFEEGQFIEAGAVLAELNPEEWLASIRQAEATAALQEVKMSRAAELREKKVISQQEYDENRAALDEARASLQLARARFAKAVIRAPFAGTLGLRKVSPGDYIEAGQDIVNLEAIDPLKVDFGIPERFASQVGTGQRVEIHVDAYPGEQFRGMVYAVDPRIDPASRRIPLRARIDNPGSRLKPGMFAEVELVLAIRENALWVPEQAIVPTTTAPFVYRVVDGKAVMTQVKTGLRRPGHVEIVDGLEAGDVVVTEGQTKLFDGAQVMVTPPPAEGGPAET